MANDLRLPGPTVLWLTGLSGSGKTTIAIHLKEILSSYGQSVLVLDGDEVRSRLHQSLGFSPDEIRENNRRIVEICRQSLPLYDVILVPVIAPFRDSRRDARDTLGSAFMEVYVRASIEEVIRRDPKGHYKKVREGKLSGFIGLSPEVPYEAPMRPDLILDTEVLDSRSCAELVVNKLIARALT